MSILQASLADTLKWLCMVVGLARILIIQNNEEIMLTRVSQLGISKNNPCNLVIAQDSVPLATDSRNENEPAEFYARFFIHAISIACNELQRYIYSTICDVRSLLSLEKLTQKLLVLFSAILKSGKICLPIG